MTTFSFKPSAFIALNMLAFLLIASWSGSVTREYWDILDRWMFNISNASLGNDVFTWLMAALSIRLADLVTLVIILGFFYLKDAIFAQQNRLSGLVGFVLTLVLMLFVRELLDLYVEIVNLNRASPTAVIDSAVRLSLLYPNFSLKDIAGDSFPGDHAAVLFTWLGYSLFFTRNKYSIAIALLVILFSLPRFMAGAHWFSDIAVGGLSVTLIALAFALYTPLLNNPQKNLSKIANNILNRIFKK
ncbi:Putative membrane protein [uncultured Candidatus Thioglobus sp.]|nr:Putative membrane protein [uncultured Candidatus Thioglobus sp.]